MVLFTDMNGIFNEYISVSGKGRPKGSVKKPKQPKQTKAKVKAAAKKSKEPKNSKTAAN